ncbi:thioesterase domain-containing protein [Actinoplanes sp. NPDC051851]|uniref:alpha/beta fold hydrolase n=1 Tax=Actinoplanes sp. NPDC051851 TaxID=3154753 RepID=UPI003417A218
MRDVPDGTPLVLLHPLGGDVFAYRHVVDALPSDRAIYAVFDGHTDVASATTWPDPQQMIDTYADEVAKTLDGRACHLAGWSLGGLLAHATAAALQQRGVTVRSVTMWDSGVAAITAERAPAPDWPAGALAVLTSLAPATGPACGPEDLRELTARLTGHDGRGVAREAGRWISTTAARLWPGVPTPGAEALGARAVVAALHRWLFSAWRPPLVDAPLQVTWAGDSLDRGLVTRTDWARFTRDTVRTDRVEATHFSIIGPPAAAQLASALATTIDLHNTADGTR